MSDNLELSASITTEEPEVAADLSELRYLVFEGMKGDPGYSPYIHAYDLTDGVMIEVFNEGDSEQFEIKDGERGADGVSPTVAFEPITVDGRTGNKMTVTDAAHPQGQSINILNGKDGEGGSGSGAVESVNGMTGAVVLDADDVGALPNTYVAPVQSVNGQTGAVNLDANDVGAVDSGTYATDMAQVRTELAGKLSTGDLPTALDDAGGITYVLALNGATVTLDRPFVAVANSLLSTARRVMFAVILAESGGDPVKFLSLTPTLLDKNNRLLTLVGEHDGSRYTAELTAASLSSTMTGTLVTEPIVTQSDIPSLTGFATETWVEGKGFQTAQDVQTAIAGIQTHDPRVAMASTDTSATLNPNTLYVFPAMASLTITLAAPADEAVVNEYHFIFSSGATATVLTLPDDLIAPDGELVTETSWKTEANQTYEVSILEGRMLEQHWGYVEVTA